MSSRGSDTQTIDGCPRGANELAICVPQRSQILFEDARATAFVTNMADAPDLMDQVGQLRVFCFGKEHAITAESYGLDEYDEYYKQLVVIDKIRGTIVGSMRLGLGDEIIHTHGYEGLYTTKYWVYRETMIELAKQGVEIGRTWIHPEYQKHIWGLALLWKALACFLDRWRCKFTFGAVSFTGYPEETREMIMNYLWRYHRSSTHLVDARQPAILKTFDRYLTEQRGLTPKQALQSLAAALERMDSHWPIPVLLRHYIKLGAVVAGEFAWNHQASKMLVLILMPAKQTQAAVDRFRSL